jgi:hypothetical protein
MDPPTRGYASDVVGLVTDSTMIGAAAVLFGWKLPKLDAGSARLLLLLLICSDSQKAVDTEAGNSPDTGTRRGSSECWTATSRFLVLRHYAGHSRWSGP